jgi:hypothetical protein
MKLANLTTHPFFVAFAIQILLAYEWAFAGIEKIIGGQFASNMPKVLTRFAEGNPHAWYVHSFLAWAKQLPTVFSHLVQWGEFLAGIGLFATLILYTFGIAPWHKKLAASVAIFCLLVGVWMNIQFYFAAGWNNVSTHSLNVLLFWAQLILIVFWSYRLKKEV